MNINQRESSLFKVLSEDIRLRILVLLTEGELCVCDIMEVLHLPQSSVSRHMAKLKASQLVIDKRDRKWVFYRLNKDINEFIPFITEILQSFRNRTPYKSDLEQLREYFKIKNCK